MIDIIIPFLRSDLYPKCIRHIKRYTRPGAYKILLIDDSSGKLGPVRAYNEGLRRTHGDVMLMNDDILVTRNWLDNMLSVDADVVVSLYHGEPYYPNISCTLVRRRVIEHVGLLDEKWFLGFGADNDWFIRITRSGFRIDVNRKNRIYHEHRASIKNVENYQPIAAAEQQLFVNKYNLDKTIN